MSEFKQYQRSQIAELRPYVVGERLDNISATNANGEPDLVTVSISEADLAAGSPKEGDMIARNPKNHADQWLVAAQYFNDNFEPVRQGVLRSEDGSLEADLEKQSISFIDAEGRN
jgi:hypothetical protein